MTTSTTTSRSPSTWSRPAPATPVGYEQTDMPSTVDVGPSGFAFTTSNDLEVTDVPRRRGPRPGLRCSTTPRRPRLRPAPPLLPGQLRGGLTVTVDLTSSDTDRGARLRPRRCSPAAPPPRTRCSTGSPPATTTLGITQPTGFTAPVDPNSYTTRTALVTAPDAWSAGETLRAPD